MTGQLIAAGPCWCCRIRFGFNPDRVTSVLIDPVLNTAADHPGADPSRSRREPLCPGCCKIINFHRRAAGLELLDERDSLEGL